MAGGRVSVLGVPKRQNDANEEKQMSDDTEVLTTTEIAVRLVEMTETLTDYTVKFDRVDWVLTRGEDEAIEFEPALAGAPGAKYTPTGERITLRLDDDEGLAVGCHYVLRLSEVPNVDQDDEL